MMNLTDQSLPSLILLCLCSMKEMMTSIIDKVVIITMMKAGTMVPMMVAVVDIAVRNYSSYNLTVPYIPETIVTTAVVVGETLLYTVVCML